MVTDGLTITSGGDVLTARLDRPPGNRLSTAFCDALTDLLLDPPPDAHVLVIAAAGDDFCLGRDRGDGGPSALRGEVAALIGLNRALVASPLLSVAAVQGDAAGFGVGLAALADITIAAASATFRFPEVEIDLAPTVVLSWLPDLVGRKQALYLTTTGAALSAADAQRYGLITTVTDDDALTDSVTAEVTRLVGHSPRVHEEIKDFGRRASALTEDQAYDLAAERLVIGSMSRRGAGSAPA